MRVNNWVPIEIVDNLDNFHGRHCNLIISFKTIKIGLQKVTLKAKYDAWVFFKL